MLRVTIPSKFPFHEWNPAYAISVDFEEDTTEYVILEALIAIHKQKGDIKRDEEWRLAKENFSKFKQAIKENVITM